MLFLNNKTDFDREIFFLEDILNEESESERARDR